MILTFSIDGLILIRYLWFMVFNATFNNISVISIRYWYLPTMYKKAVSI